MSKKANLISLRKKVVNNFKIFENNSKLLIKKIQFLKVFIFFLQKKGIWVFKSHIYINKSICKIYLNIFISTKKIFFYKKSTVLLLGNNKYAKYLNNKKSIKQHSLYLKNKKDSILKFNKLSLIVSYFYKKLSFFLNIESLNKKLKKKYLMYFYFRTIKYKTLLFQRRFYLYFDTIKIMALFYQKLIHTSYFLFTLSTILKYLSKKLHTKFLLFVEILIYSLVYNAFRKDRRAKDAVGVLKGIKFKLNGKIKGKMRATSHLIKYGNIPNQSIDLNIEYSMIHTYTRYGVFGMQAWVYK